MTHDTTTQAHRLALQLDRTSVRLMNQAADTYPTDPKAADDMATRAWHCDTQVSELLRGTGVDL